MANAVPEAFKIKCPKKTSIFCHSISKKKVESIYDLTISYWTGPVFIILQLGGPLGSFSVSL